MSEFYDTVLSFDKLTTTELDAIALEHAGVVGGIGYGYARTGKIPTRTDGWSARWINTGGMGNCGTLVLVGTTPRTRSLRRQGVVSSWVDAGLTYKQAEALWGMDVQYKHELVSMLVDVLRVPYKVTALRAHPLQYGAGTGRTQWLKGWGVDLGLSAARECALATMVVSLTK